MRERLLGVADDLGTVVRNDEDDDSGEASKPAGIFAPEQKKERSQGNGIWASTDTVNLKIPDLSPAPAEDEPEPRED